MMQKYISFFFKLLLILFVNFSVIAQQAEFTASNTQGCSNFPLAVVFTNQSVGATSYFWDFGDGATSTLLNPNHTYLVPGIYDVTLISINGTTSDTIIKYDYIKYYKAPVANFTQDKTQGCMPLTVIFDNLTVIGDTTFSSIKWVFGDGQTSADYEPIHTYTTPGSFTVSLEVNDYHTCNSKKISTYKIIVSDNPLNASFTIDKPIGCSIPHNIDITNNFIDTTLTYSWNFGNGDTSILVNPPQQTYTDFGSYVVSLVIENSDGCRDSTSQTVDVIPFTSDFKIDTNAGCSPFTVSFSDLSSQGTTFWNWNFGDTQTSTSKNPTHKYLISGNYSIQLISGNANCSDTITKIIDIIIYSKPNVTFTTIDSSACEIPFDFNFSYTGPFAQIFSWDFGNGITSTEQNPVITYSDTGHYDVTLMVTDTNNCKDTLIKEEYINIVLPWAHYGFFIKKGCIPLSVEFLDSSTSVENFSHWYWDFGDGTPVVDFQSPTHVFADTGVFSVNLIIENIKGCRDSVLLEDTVLVGDHKNVSFLPTDSAGCYKFNLQFTDLSDSIGDEWNWDFGDGGSDINQNPSHTYADTGYFDVCLTVGFHGCYDTFCKDSVAQVFPPISRFSPSISVACDTPLTVSFTDMSVLADYWEWEFDNVIPTTFIGQTPPDVTYNQQGFYTVKLLVKNLTDGYGCMDSSIQTISISDIHVGFYPDTTKGCMPFNCLFTDTSTCNTSIINRYWFYGDGYIFDTTITTASHIYQNNGFYNVELIVSDQLGCFEPLIIDSLIEVKNLPSPGFISDKTNGCTPLTINFSDTTNNPAPIVNWFWTFGDDSTSIDSNPTHIYDRRGVYNVGLTVIDENNCVGSDSIVNYITATYPVSGFTSNSVVCNNQSVTFISTSTSTPNATNDTLFFEWDFGDGTPISTLVNPSHTYSTNSDTAVNYNIILKVTDRNGCIDTTIKTITISYIKANFYPDNTKATCSPFSVTFTDTSSTSPGVLNYWKWDFGVGYPLNDTSLPKPTNTYVTPGFFDVQLIAGNSYGCKDTLKIDSLISVKGPQGTIWYSVDSSKCTPVYTLFASTDVVVKYYWDFKDGTDSTFFNSFDSIIHIYAFGTWKPILLFWDSTDCPGKAELDTTIVVDFPFVPTSSSSTSAICTSATGTATVIANGDKPPFTYLWTNNDTLNFADSLTFGYYRATVTDSIGCIGVEEITVDKRDSVYQNTFTIIDEECTGSNGKATSSPSLGTPPYSYLWYNNVTTDSLNNLAKGTYQLTITDALGCLKIDSAKIGQSFKEFLSNITKKDIVCVNKSGIVSVTPDGTPPFTYSWNTGNYSSSIINLDTGKYSVTIIDALGCIISASANVEMLLNTTIDAGFISDTNNVLSVIPITFTSTSVDTIPISTYNWYIDDKTFTDTLGIRTYRFEDAGIYNVMLKITDNFGCIDSFSASITIKDGLEVPNVFSPNGDGENDVFYIQHSGIESFKIDIFNRWGVLLFTETAPKVYWTGRTTAGVDVPDGVYYYILEATTVLGEIYKLTGNIQLFR